MERRRVRNRDGNYVTASDLEIGAKIDKQLKWADRQKIPYVLITGPQELKDNSFTLKDMKKAEQKTFDSLQKLIDVL